MRGVFNPVTWVQPAIEVTHLIIFFMVPLILWPQTSELFELNKIYLTYLAAATLLTLELVKTISSKNPVIVRPALVIPGLLFLAALLVATATSTNIHASLFGNYGRFHGGLLSWLAYGVIYLSLVQQTKETYLNIIKVSLASAIFVAGWGVLERLGIDASYWEQDVQARVFSTLGQPNWLAAYLAMLIPWGISFYLKAKIGWQSLGMFGLVLLLYTCFIFTYSRGGNYGLAVGLAVYMLILSQQVLKQYWKKITLVGSALAIVTILFATPLATQYFGASSPRVVENLEAGNETGNIRLIVWQGAWQSFLDKPLTGHGLETFGEVFYKFRPVEMNQTGEWDFLFNRAHNEYLNYLATTGLLGTGAYLVLVAAFYWQARRFLRRERQSPYFLAIAAAVASMTAYLIQNIFGFTVVPLALLFVLNLASLGLGRGDKILFTLPQAVKKLVALKMQLVLFLPLVAGLIAISNFWRADLEYVEGAVANDLGQNERAEFYLDRALRLNPWEPNYLIQLSFAKASLSKKMGPSSSGLTLAEEAVKVADRATNLSPHSLPLRRIRTQIFEILTETNSKYLPNLEQSWLTQVDLAPTEPRTYLGTGSFYKKNGQKDLALKYLLMASSLKPDWLPPLLELVNFYRDQKDFARAKLYLTQAQKIAPKNPEVEALSQKEDP